MTSHSKRKAVREHRDATGDGHTEAVRAVAASRAPSMADCDPAEVPAPVAVMMARNLHAARLHLNAVYRLAQNNGVLPFFRSDKPTGMAARLDAALSQLGSRVLDLRDWSERTAHHSGAIDSVPEILSNDNASETARQALYPELEGAAGESWCTAEGGRMPLPGESHVDFDPNSAPDAIRHNLPGPVPDWHLSAHATGINVRKAGDIAPGTPATPIWQAHDQLSRYLSGWMYRGGDSPADLAIALDGLSELADALPAAVEAICREIEQRSASGQLHGVDQTRLAKAQARFTAMTAELNEENHGRRNHLRGAIGEIRRAVTGAAPVLPAKPGMRAALERIAPRFNGRTAIQIRAELGKEAFAQRQVSKTRAANYDRQDLIARMLTWMHVTGATTYDATAHLAAEA
ncbi:MAG: hypothetical protein QOF58_7988 [Pseudonocardiales bacterium]|jgi:hypothetical protein|nr:hypothetical protein [Pseudonocardiales bacterium]